MLVNITNIIYIDIKNKIIHIIERMLLYKPQKKTNIMEKKEKNRYIKI